MGKERGSGSAVAPGAPLQWPRDAFVIARPSLAGLGPPGHGFSGSARGCRSSGHHEVHLGWARRGQDQL